MQHSERLIGRFGSRTGSQIWEVRWHESTGEVRALARSDSDSPTEEQLVLGVVPTHDHLVAALSAIDDRRGSKSWRQSAGIETLRDWLAMVEAALDGNLGVAGEPEGAIPRYLDLGHLRRDVDGLTDQLVVPELWAELTDMLREAQSILDDLRASVEADGNLARAAHSALELASLTSTLHIALADAYRVVHQRRD